MPCYYSPLCSRLEPLLLSGSKTSKVAECSYFLLNFFSFSLSRFLHPVCHSFLVVNDNASVCWSHLILNFDIYCFHFNMKLEEPCGSWMFLLRPQQAVTCSGVMLFGSTVELNFHGLLVVCDSLLLRSLVLTTVCSLTHSLVHPLASSAILPVASLTHSLNCSVTCHSLGTTHSPTLSLADDTRDEAFCLFPRFKIQIE